MVVALTFGEVVDVLVVVVVVVLVVVVDELAEVVDVDELPESPEVDVEHEVEVDVETAAGWITGVMVTIVGLLLDVESDPVDVSVEPLPDELEPDVDEPPVEEPPSSLVDAPDGFV